MINKELKIKKTYKIKSITCDHCGKEYNDLMEIQEFLNYSNIGGYNSIFGDGNKIEFDLCQYCLKEILNKENIKYNVY